MRDSVIVRSSPGTVERLHSVPSRQGADQATESGARTLGVEDEHGIEEGKPADCVIFDAPTPIDVISLRATRRYVIRRGRVIAETTPARTTLLGDPVNFAVAGQS